MKVKFWSLLLFTAIPLLLKAEQTIDEKLNSLTGFEASSHKHSHSKHKHHKHHCCEKRDNNNNGEKAIFGFYYSDEEPVVLFGEKIVFNRRTHQSSHISRSLTLDDIVFDKPGNYLITFSVTGKRVAIESGTRIPITTLSGGFLVALFHHDIKSGRTFEVPGSRYGVLTEFEDVIGGIETQQLFGQVIVKIESKGSSISLRSLTPVVIDDTTISSLQLQNRVSNPNFETEPNTSASISIQKIN